MISNLDMEIEILYQKKKNNKYLNALKYFIRTTKYFYISVYTNLTRFYFSIDIYFVKPYFKNRLLWIKKPRLVFVYQFAYLIFYIFIEFKFIILWTAILNIKKVTKLNWMLYINRVLLGRPYFCALWLDSVIQIFHSYIMAANIIILKYNLDEQV